MYIASVRLGVPLFPLGPHPHFLAQPPGDAAARKPHGHGDRRALVPHGPDDKSDVSAYVLKRVASKPKRKSLVSRCFRLGFKGTFVASAFETQARIALFLRRL